ncbi:hypothetical protein SCLCIDRAFT_1211522 [Scleroderma citrinum Foug A]|uniref:Uncharacterized protein n=1 Tax=Scleroderma citrinum Foug A TaxID=1036808 RepID=A0A0C2ZXX1_9AGAM|nr:hypothetical protein SCLCIDRAFT_1211522 [Scleroderma citrinum Foug A]
MFSNVLFSTFAVALILNLVGAEPVDRRFDVGSAIDSATAAILSLVSVLTSDAASLYSEGTLEGVSWYTVGTSYAYVCVHQGVSEGRNANFGHQTEANERYSQCPPSFSPMVER